MLFKLTDHLRGKEAWRPTPKWNTRFFFAFSGRTQLWLPMVRRKWENSPGKIKKMEGKEKALEGKITKYPVVPSEIRTHDLLLTGQKL